MGYKIGILIWKCRIEMFVGFLTLMRVILGLDSKEDLSSLSSRCKCECCACGIGFDSQDGNLLLDFCMC